MTMSTYIVGFLLLVAGYFWPPVARTLSLLRRDSSRRRVDIGMSVDAARKRRVHAHGGPVWFRLRRVRQSVPTG
jgi:hypothetical protein